MSGILAPLLGALARARELATAAPPLAPAADTAGGDDHLADESPTWDGGRYLGAQWSPIHPGRVGRAIRPWCVVVHTTDMHPSTFGALLRRWQRIADRGAGAHFLLGRDSSQGLHQLARVDRNGNHAGGPTHGWLDVAGKRVHPNAVSVGIEVHCAGNVIERGGRWWCWQRKDVDGDGDRDLVPVGEPLPPEDVEPDPRHPGRGWHRPSAYQLGELERLLYALGHCPVLVPPPPASQWGVSPNGAEHLPRWAPPPHGTVGTVPVLGHCSLDPARKTDPGPVLSRWLAQLG